MKAHDIDLVQLSKRKTKPYWSFTYLAFLYLVLVAFGPFFVSDRCFLKVRMFSFRTCPIVVVCLMQT